MIRQRYDYLVVGAGMAGGRAAFALSAAKRGSVGLVGQEAHPPYDRTRVSKGHLVGDAPSGPWLAPAGPAPEHLCGVSATALDPDAREVTLSDGHTVGYGKLLIATGIRARRLDPPDAPSFPTAGVHYLRTLDDADSLRTALAANNHVVLIGGGFIGLEVASAAVAMGLEVDVVERLPLPLSDSLGGEVARRVHDYVSERGVRFRASTTVRGFQHDTSGALAAVQTRDGELPARLAVVGIGGVPNTEWLAGSGVATADGIVVDEFCRTSVPDVWAAGDVARYPFAGAELIRVEHESHAQTHALTAARNILGRVTPYRSVPFVWSEHFGRYLWSVGLPSLGRETLTCGALAGAHFVTAHLRDGAVVAVTGADGRALIPSARQLITRRARVRSAADLAHVLAS